MVSESYEHWLSFSLTPVQGFIAAARSVRDLAVGSLLLCYLVGEALEAARNMGGVLLFPNIPRGDEAVSIPNQFVMTFTSREAAEIAACVAVKAVRDAWKQMADAVHSLLAKRWKPGWDADWDTQISTFWDPRTWVLSADQVEAATYARLFPGQSDVGNAIKRQWDVLALALGTAKQVRYFPCDQGIGRSKCTLLSDLEQMGPGGTVGELTAFWQIAATLPYKGARIGMRDRLCAVSLVKRFAPIVATSTPLKEWQERVQDTAEIATAVWRKNAQSYLEWNTFAEAADDLNRLLGPARESRARWLIDADLTINALAKEVSGLDQDAVSPIIKRLRPSRDALIRATGAELGAPARYLAVIALDGDKMGERLSGKFCAEREYTEEFFGDLSAKLRGYAKSTREIVERYDGLHIYAGGDDVLAFVPLSQVLQCALELREYFPQLPGSKNPRTTASAGVAIFHYMHDLRDALHEAREAEHTAKENGRDACGISLLKRSGGNLHAVLCWDELEALIQMRDLFASGASDRWASRLAQNTPAMAHGVTEPQIRLLIGHYIMRTEGGTAQQQDAMTKSARNIWTRCYDRQHNDPGLAFERFQSCIGIASFLARGREQ